MLSAMYGLDFPVKSFAISNEFVERMNKGCYQLGKNLQPFCFYAKELQKQWGVLDITQFSGFVDPEKTLVQEITEYRRDVYLKSNFGVLPYNDLVTKALFYDYLLSISLCYIEVPKFITKNGAKQKTFDKMLATRNPAIMAAWMGYSVNEMQAKYTPKIKLSNVDFIGGELRAVRLVSNAKGNSISCPRNNFSVDEMTCIPLFMLYAMTNGFYSCMEEGIVKFTYLKDNDVVRELPTTVNFDILMDYYKDSQFISTMLEGVDVFTEDQGGMTLSSKQSRGYIKVPELGSSRYDQTGVRSLNIARLLRMEKVSEVDRTFIDVDLDAVMSSFFHFTDILMLHEPNQIAELYKAISNTDEDLQYMSSVAAMAKLKEYVETCDLLMTTSFKRALHVFMVDHVNWFPSYTGQPVANSAISNSKSFGVEQMDF